MLHDLAVLVFVNLSIKFIFLAHVQYKFNGGKKYLIKYSRFYNTRELNLGSSSSQKTKLFNGVCDYVMKWQPQ